MDRRVQCLMFGCWIFTGCLGPAGVAGSSAGTGGTGSADGGDGDGTGGTDNADESGAPAGCDDLVWFEGNYEHDPETPLCPQFNAVMGNVSSGYPDVSGLDCLCEVSGHVDLDLDDGFDGLPNLRSVGGDLDLRGGSEMIEVGGFDSLVFVDTLVARDPMNIVGMPLLEEVATISTIHELYGLDSLRRVGNIASDGADLGLNGVIEVTGEVRVFATGGFLGDFTGLQSLETVGGDLFFGGNSGIHLDVFTGLPSLRTIGGDVNIHSGDMTGFTGLQSLETIGGHLQIPGTGFATPALEDLSGLTSLREVGTWVRMDLGSVPEITGLGALESVGDSLTITGEGPLTSLAGFESLTTVGDDLVIEYFQQLTDMSALSNVETIGGDVVINDVGLCMSDVDSWAAGVDVAGEITVTGLEC